MLQVAISAGFVPLGGFLADWKEPNTAAFLTRSPNSTSCSPPRSSSYSPIRVSMP